MKNRFIDNISLLLISILIVTTGYMLLEFWTGAFEKHKSWVDAIDINDQNIIATASGNDLFLWDKRHCTTRLTAHSNTIKSIAFSHSGKFIVSGSIDKSVKIWSLQAKRSIKELARHANGVNKVAFSQSDNYVISAGYDNKLVIWDWKNGKSIKELNISIDVNHPGFSISKSDILVYVDTSCNLKLFNITKLEEIASYRNYCGEPQFDPSGKIIAVKLKDGLFNFIDINNGKTMLELKTDQDSDPFEIFKFTPDGKGLATGISGGDIEIWDWQQKTLIRVLKDDSFNQTSTDDIAFSNDSELLSANGRSVKIWNWKNGDLKMVIGDGMYQTKLTGLLSIIILLNLVCGFCGILINAQNRYSSIAIVSILSAWSLGILLLLFLVKSRFVKYATAISWITTTISGLFVLTGYGAMQSLYTLPIGLFAGYMQIMYDRENKGAFIPVVINLILCGVICSFIVRAIEANFPLSFH